MKKVLSLVLVIAMVLSSMSFAFAGTFTDMTDSNYEAAVNTLAGLGIVTGYEDGTYRPGRTVTRAEMAKLMVEILGYGDLVAGSKSNFADTQGHWADPWIAIAAGRGIVVGTGAGQFTPDRQVSYDEALTMIVRGLGYTDDSNEIKTMPWPTNFKIKAAELGITDGVKMNTTGADRGGVAQALYNALDATLVSVDSEGDVTYLTDADNYAKILLTRIADKRGNENAGSDKAFVVNPDMLNPDKAVYAGNVVDLTPYMYQNLLVYVDKNDYDKVLYVAKSYDDTVEGTFTVPSSPAAEEIKVELADGSTEVIAISDTDSYKVFYNGKETLLTEDVMENGGESSSSVTYGTVGLDGAKVTVVLKEDNSVKSIVATNATFGDQVVRAYKSGSTSFGQIKLPKKADKVDLSKVTVTGAVDDINDIEIDDVVIAYAAAGYDKTEVPSKVKLVVVRDTVEGKITKVNSASDTVYIDGVKYAISTIDGVGSFALGDEGTFFLDDAGNVFTSEASTASDAKDYAVVIDALDGLVNNTRIVLNAEIKLINANGDVVTYGIDKDAVYQGTSTKIVTKNETDITFNTYDHDGDAEDAEVPTAEVSPVTGSLIKYSLNSDGKISKLSIVAPDATDTAATLANVDTTKASFDVAENAPIFNIKALDTTSSNYSVVDPADLPKTLDFTYYALTTGGQYKVLVTTGAVESTGKYGIITAINNILNEDDDPVVEITAYKDGKEVIYETTTADYADTDAVKAIDANIVNKGLVVQFTTNSDGKVTNIAVEGIDVDGTNKYIDAATSVRVHLTADGSTGTWYELNTDDVTVYVLKSDSKLDSVGSVDDLEGYDVVGLYNTDSNANDYEILIVK